MIEELSPSQVENIIYSLPVNIHKKRGDEIVMFCPFHRDGKNPNYSFNIVKQMGGCWSCNSRHNLYSFVLELTGENVYEKFNISREDSAFSRINREETSL